MSASPDDLTRQPGSTVELSGKREPITHPLETSASRLTLIFLWFTAVIVGVGFGLEMLKAKGFVRRNDLTFFLILASLPFLGVLFNLARSWRIWPEVRAMRRGDYLARWSYSPEMGRLLDTQASEILRSAVAHDRTWRVKFLFWFPFWVIFGCAVVLGTIGSFAKSNPMLVLTVSFHGLWSGALAGAIIAAPAYFLLGVAQRIASTHEPVVIFTRSGFYTPGRFIPVMDFAQSRRKVSFEVGENGAPSRLYFELRQGVSSLPGRHHNTTVAVDYEIPVPPACVEEARALAKHYQS